MQQAPDTLAAVPTLAPAQPQIGFGVVRHARLAPVRNAFAYPTYFLMLPMRSMQTAGSGALAVNRPAALSFYDADHGDGRSPQAGGALGWLFELLNSHGIRTVAQGADNTSDPADGEVWLHCYPRVLGHTFKPVSFWYCHRADGSLRAIVVEVNNTFGERHCYLLDHPRYGRELRADKVFHVSPFCPVEGGYRFRFMVNADRSRTVARIDFDDANGPVIETSVSGALEPATAAAIRRALWRYPAMTVGVVARIHWQAIRLFFKRVPFFSKPTPPAVFTSRSLRPPFTDDIAHE
jgi:DUF1365 family protein